MTMNNKKTTFFFLCSILLVSFSTCLLVGGAMKASESLDMNMNSNELKASSPELVQKKDGKNKMKALVYSKTSGKTLLISQSASTGGSGTIAVPASSPSNSNDTSNAGQSSKLAFNLLTILFILILF